jgi:hypothetical protein
VTTHGVRECRDAMHGGSTLLDPPKSDAKLA